MNQQEGQARFSSAKMQQARAELATKAESMRTILETDIKTIFNKIGDEGVWSGTAANAKKEEFDELASKFDEFMKSVESCCTYLDGVVANYQELENAVKGQ